MARRNQLREIPRPIDWTLHHDEYRDRRQWVSFGLVEREEDGSPVDFNREDGQVYVNVELQPSKVPVRCRIGSDIAGAGEGAYFPFLPGDEVLVVLPNGREDAGGVIIARLNNVHDAFPMDSVAGQDPTTNSFAFRRRRTPHVEEFAGPITLRNALSGAVVSLDNKGGVTIKDGENSALQISADAISLTGPSSSDQAPKMLLQMNLTELRAMLQVDDAQLLINSSSAGDPSSLVLPTGLQLALGTNQPAEHVATVEFVCALFNALLAVMGPFGSAAQAALDILLATGQTALLPSTASALASGLPLAAQTPKPPASPTGVQLAPGLGAVGFRTG